MKRTQPTNKNPQLQAKILDHLQTLGVPVSDEQLDGVLREAEQASWSHLELLDRLLQEQAEQRRQRAIERRIRQAKFDEIRTLEAFDWKFNAQAIDRVQFEELATGDFIRRRDNLVMVGQSGIGKTHLLKGISLKACALGYRVRYVASDKLLADLVSSLADDTTPRRIGHYARVDLQVIDGFGFDKLQREAMPQALSLLYKLIDQRNGRRSTALISNIDLKAWTEYLGDPPMVMALLDRLVDQAILIRIEKAKSFRAHRGKQATANARRASNKSAPSKASAKASSKAK